MAKLRISLRALESILGLPVSGVSAVEMDAYGLLSLTVTGLEYAEGAEVVAAQLLHDCDGERWYRTEVTVPEPVARKIEIPA
jgi:hypothetical protein